MTPKIRVLLVDDHAVVRQGLQSLLADDPDVALVGEAGDGQTALQQVEALHPDVILLVIRMPGMDGLEVTRRLRASHPEVRIIILTTYAEDEYLVEVLRTGAQGYLLKSILYEDLVRAIKDVYHGSRSLAPDLVGRVMELAGSLARGQPTTVAVTVPPVTRPQTADVATRFDARFGAGSWQNALEARTNGTSDADIAKQLSTTKQTVHNWLVKGGIVERIPGRGRPARSEDQAHILSEREMEILRIVAGGASNKEVAIRLSISINTVRVHIHDIFRKLGIKTRTQAALYVLRMEK